MLILTAPKYALLNYVIFSYMLLNSYIHIINVS